MDNQVASQKKDDNSDQIERYKSAIDLMVADSQWFWSVFSTFLIAHSVLLGFITQSAFKENVQFISVNYPCFTTGIIGLLLILPWWFTYKRNADFYYLRLFQAQNAEPENWNLLKEQGEKFSMGEAVQISSTITRKISFWGGVMKNTRAINILILTFTLAYSGIIIVFGPWWC